MIARCKYCDETVGPDRVYFGIAGPFCNADHRDIHFGFLCPEPACGSRGAHEDNGGKGVDKAYCCADCGTHFDAVKGAV